jgi:hypothetical protein
MIYKFYIIKSDKGDKVYIGSTTQELKKRWRHHKSDKKVCTSSILFEEYGKDNCIIELICEIEFETIQEARKEEGRLIREAGDNAVNKVIPGRSQKEYHNKWYEKNKVAKIKEYRTNNKEKISARRKIAYEKNKEIILAKAKIAYQKKKLTLQ